MAHPLSSTPEGSQVLLFLLPRRSCNRRPTRTFVGTSAQRVHSMLGTCKRKPVQMYKLWCQPDFSPEHAHSARSTGSRRRRQGPKTSRARRDPASELTSIRGQCKELVQRSTVRLRQRVNVLTPSVVSTPRRRKPPLAVSAACGGRPSVSRRCPQRYSCLQPRRPGGTGAPHPQALLSTQKEKDAPFTIRRLNCTSPLKQCRWSSGS